MITEINELKTRTKYISCDCKCKFDDRKCNLNQKWNNDKYQCKCKNTTKHHVCINVYVWNSRTCAWEINKYLKVLLMIY